MVIKSLIVSLARVDLQSLLICFIVLNLLSHSAVDTGRLRTKSTRIKMLGASVETF